ncbi:MAG: anthranilate phosphoribosyltransferase [Sulfuricurvum sp. GWF2_44_89]|uniref:Anthranilate phosphoribosyltransferase n=1 Tax=Sulfuricurvum kujiense TaxID=148813 RepID=A0A2D3WMJ8_9BACT|nr:MULTISPECIES: anthranilate phosphoribosyltransferase [Sulfuricurvum]OHD78824.1 MAG: anthranilate phosphoribosyltransferase [Sulfuricurvum sp. GWF2_44_89]OHD95421.1 MAG: anthranilate phosphoribosyltransferase [Sulfuricurvum sp. RIFOXYD12_FULL_44_77]OHD96547.1 MAG: anthranilate phosphoribosyltransferase [Sulfuricurvum sp. RIFOXYD2_FULL_44_160]DAB38349.1 MAG TPA: anthranilate phosphoribosyltransferase [Sulfuricurvum kujiense]
MNATKADFEALFEHKMSDEEMREFLLSLSLNTQTSSEMIATAAEVMRRHSILLEVPAELKPKLIDVVGTGGDKSGSFNVSSTVALLLAASGAYVAKHGNRSITSKSGSADVLEYLGVKLDLTLEQSSTLLQECGFTFLFAQYHHPAMKFIMPIRRSIPEKTIFNILGPLTNPVGLSKILLGVFDEVFVPKMAEAARELGMQSAIVVSSREKMDEISISDITYAGHLKNGVIEYFEIDPQMLGIKKAPFEAILGGEAERNAEILTDILNNRSTEAQRDMVLINAAYALVAEGMARDAQEGLEIARDTLLSGKAAEKLKQIVSVSSKL